MQNAVHKILHFIKGEAVLAAALLLALVSACLVPPDKGYFDYIDWHTLLLLFSLMAVMAGFQDMGIFRRIGNGLLGKIRNVREMLLVLTFLPFFFSMLITNDVGLITFVPFALIVLSMAKREDLALPLVVLQTIAANLGSMLTPMGNPQNLYLYARSGMDPLSFILLMLPYTLLSALLLFAAALLIKNGPIARMEIEKEQTIPQGKRLAAYCSLFLLCLLSVAKVLHPLLVAAVTAAYLLLRDRKLFRQVDYSLLCTFIGFFIFIGNMGRMEGFRSFLSGILTGHEQLIAILSSQIISNVPAALLLSGFSSHWNALIVGTNLGGLGTLIASMASLISYKQICRAYPDLKGRYFRLFTLANVIMLVLLMGFSFFICVP